MQTVWITRTLGSRGYCGAQESAARFEALGLKPIIAPLLTLGPPPVMPPMPPHNAILIFTSPNGVDAFCGLSDARHYPVITVGDKTAQICKLAGFTDVTSASGTAADVTALILKNPHPDCPYWHMAGRHVRGAITEDLYAAGLRAERHMIYVSAPVTALPEIDLKAVDVIALYSPLAAKTLAGFAPDVTSLTALSISAATDCGLGALMFKARVIADAPNEGAMLKALSGWRL